MIEYQRFLKIYKRSPWTDWLMLHERPASDYTIAEYKRCFKGRRPEWAMTFAERKVRSTRVSIDRYKNSFPVPDESWDRDHWFIERELLIPDKNIKRQIVIERILDIGGRCKKITLIHLEGRAKPLFVHEENKVGKGKWARTTREVNDEAFINRNWPVFRDLPDMWAKYF